MINLLDILSPDSVKVPLAANDKQPAIDELVDLLAQAGRITDPDTVKRVVWEREQQRSTGIGEGLAIPHGKSDASPSLVMAVGRPAAPIEFSAIDGKPVRLLILLISPPNRTSEHIQTLGKISRMMVDPSMRRRAYNAESAESLYQLFVEAEEAAAQPSA